LDEQASKEATKQRSEAERQQFDRNWTTCTFPPPFQKCKWSQNLAIQILNSEKGFNLN
jgi:hypothetical protein